MMLTRGVNQLALVVKVSHVILWPLKDATHVYII